MPSVRLEDLTPFGRLALKLEREFSELSRAAEQISRLDLETDGGLDDGIKILNRVSEYGESLAGTMQQFSASLQEAQVQAEAAAKLVAERAQLIQTRRRRQDELHEKLSRLKEDVGATGAALAGLGQSAQGAPSEDDKRRIASELSRLREPLDRFIAAAQELKAEAARANFRRLERQADSMVDSLQASRRKIAQALGDAGPR